MRSAVISLGSNSSLWTIEAMKKYFDSVENISLKEIDVNIGDGKLEVIYNGLQLQEFDCIYAKGSFRYAALLQSITKALSPKCYMPLSTNSYPIAHDKLLTHLALLQNKIPMPKTYLSSTVISAKKILESVIYPIVMKFPHGTGGKGVMFADSYASASSMFDALAALRQPFLIQEYIETGGVDIRAIVAGDEVIACMKRKAVIGEKRANIHTGGTGESYNLNVQGKDLAIKTAKSIGAEICAVDMLESRKGYVVIEANVSPGLQGITKATNIDVADRIANYLHKRTSEFIESKKKQTTSKIFEYLDIKKQDTTQQIISNIDFRGDRILLPKIVTSLSKFKEKEEVLIKVSKERIEIRK
ncbi:MAG: RimK family alpha-L-glutamate ligase [Nanoarchaeota archaeon]